MPTHATSTVQTSSTKLPTVVLTGAESTGKTTLVRTLAKQYGTAWVPECARVFVEQHHRAPTLADVPHLAASHLCAVRRARSRAHRVLLLDTDLLSTVLYSRHYFGACPPRVEAVARRHRADLYLLLADDIPWVPDPGQRDGPETRARLQPQFARLLDEAGVRWTSVSGSFEDRLRQATAHVDALLRSE